MNLDATLRALAQCARILVATDFDGTVAHITPHPDETVAHPRAMTALLSLADLSGVQVAIVSGRTHRDLLRLVPDGRILLIGEHGNDLGTDSDRDPVIQRITPIVVEIASNLDGSYVEHKNNSIAFHWRQTTEDPVPAVKALEALADAEPDVSVLHGKKVIEMSVAKLTKADAVTELAEDLDGLLFMGDDITDETVFEAMGPSGVSVKVGEGPTAARYRVDGVNQVADLLEDLVSIRRRRMGAVDSRDG